jgi:hypothetical protein
VLSVPVTGEGPADSRNLIVEGAMTHRSRVALSILGLAMVASAVRAQDRATDLPADYPKKVTLFGTEYNVQVVNRAGTYKNGTKITAQTPTADFDTKQKANLSFAPGADAASDRLFVAAPIGGNDEGPTGDQLYVLTGSDPQTGEFNQAVSEATSFFGGNVDINKAGRPNTVTFLSDVNTGPKKDKNLVLTTFTGDDTYAFYDLDTLSGDYINDAVLRIKVPRIAQAAGEDPAVGVPNSGWLNTALGPNNTIIVIARTEGDSSIEVGVMDLSKDTFADAKTDLVEATGGKIDPPNQIPHAIARVAENEYWLLTSELDQGGNLDSAGQQNLYHLRITVPTDLAAATLGSIKAEVLGQEDLTSKKLGLSEGGIFGMTVGRELAPGKRVVYMADWLGHVLTLTPVVTTPAPTAGG